MKYRIIVWLSYLMQMTAICTITFALGVLIYVLIETITYIPEKLSLAMLSRYCKGFTFSVVSVVLFFLAGRLSRRFRHTLLFLRRFRAEDRYQVVGSALSGLDARWRVITLDDESAEPMGIHRAGQHIILNICLVIVGVVLIIAGFYFNYSRLTDMGLLDEISELVSECTFSSADLLNQLTCIARKFWANFLDTFLWSTRAFFDDPRTVEIEIGQIAFIVILIFVTLFALGISLIAIGTYKLLSLFYANKKRRCDITKQQDLDRVTRKLERRQKRVFCPRMSLVTSHSSLWKKTVSRLGRFSMAIIIDISEPTDNIVWEAKWSTSLQGKIILFIMDSVMMEQYQNQTGEHDPWKDLRNLAFAPAIGVYDLGKNNEIFRDFLSSYLDKYKITTTR